jgi:signal transduction histidine kinase
MHTLAHDLRNPLTSVVMGADLLRLGNLPAEHGETVRRLRTHAQKMTRLIDDLMDAEAIENGQRQFQFARIDLTRAVRAAVEAFAEPAAFKQLRLEIDLPGDSIHAETDEGALRQVIDNLVSNAVKYSPAGRSIEVSLRVEAGEARCVISDHGPGFGPEEIDRLFRKFGKGRAQPTGGEKSSGLGLWIAKRVVDALGGRIWCESEPGRGARFHVALPLRGPGKSVG